MVFVNRAATNKRKPMLFETPTCKAPTKMVQRGTDNLLDGKAHCCFGCCCCCCSRGRVTAPLGIFGQCREEGHPPPSALQMLRHHQNRNALGWAVIFSPSAAQIELWRSMQNHGIPNWVLGVVEYRKGGALVVTLRRCVAVQTTARIRCTICVDICMYSDFEPEQLEPWSQ